MDLGLTVMHNNVLNSINLLTFFASRNSYCVGKVKSENNDFSVSERINTLKATMNSSKIPVLNQVKYINMCCIGNVVGQI